MADYLLLKSKLSEEDFKSASKLLEAIKAPSDILSLVGILSSIKAAYDVALKVTWPEILRLQYESELDTIQKSQSILFNLVKDNKITTDTHASISPLKGIINDYPIAAIFAEPINYRQYDPQFSILKIVTFIIFQLCKSKSISPNKIIQINSQFRSIINGRHKFSFALKTLEFNANKLTHVLEGLKKSEKYFISDSIINSWENYFNGYVLNDITTKNEPIVSYNPKIKNIKNEYFTEDPITLENHDELSKLIDKDTAALVCKKNNSVTSNSPIDFFPKNSIQQRLKIPYRSDALTEYEEHDVVVFLISVLQSKASRDSDYHIALLSIIKILTSKSLEYILSLPVYFNSMNSQTQDHLCLANGGSWVKNSIKKTQSISGENYKLVLNNFCNKLELPLGDIITSVLKTLFKNVGEGKSLREILLIDDDLYLSSFITAVRANKNNLGLKLHRNVTDQQLSRSGYEWISQRYSNGIASLILSNTEFDKTTILYYLSLNTKFAESIFLERLNNIGLNSIQEEQPYLRAENYTGSELSLSSETVCNTVTSKLEKLMKGVSTAYNSVEKAVSFHNELTQYITGMMVFSTCHRGTSEYGFNDYTINLERGLILVFDKHSFESQPYRIIPLPKIVIEQLCHYKTHLKNFAYLLKNQKSALAKSLKLVSSDQVVDIPLLFVINDNEIQPVGKRNFEQLFSELSLPENFNRHYFVDQLVEHQEFKNIEYLLGHETIADTVLGKTSCASLTDLSLLEVSLESILTKSGFKLVEIGSKHNIKNDLKINHELYNYYIPKRFKASKKPIFKFINRLIKQYKILSRQFKELNDSDVAFQMLSEWAANDDQSEKISTVKKNNLITRFLKKINSSNSLKIIQPDISLSFIDHCLISSISERDKVVEAINSLLFGNSDKQSVIIDINKYDLLWVKFVLSLLLHNALPKVENYKQLYNWTKTIMYSEVGLNLTSLCSDNGLQQPILIDNVSMLFWMEAVRKGPINITDFKRTINMVLKYLSRNPNLALNTKKSMLSVDSLLKFMKKSWDPEQPTILKSYGCGELDTTPLSHERMVRWLSNGNVKVASQKIPKTKFLSNNNQSYILSKSGLLKHTLELYRKIHDVLNKENEGITNRSITLYNLIIQTWASFINVPKKTHLSEIVKASTKITAQGITYFLWLLDVSKRPGKTQDNIAIGTLKGYASKSKALLTEYDYQSEYFLQLESDDLVDWYRRSAATSKANKSHFDYVAKIKDYHQFLVNNFNFEKVEWHLVEPKLHDSEAIADANIISFNEYSTSIEVITINDSLSSNLKALASIALILMYRIGLRPDDARGLMVDDFDFRHQVLHVRSNRIRRVKSINGNRILSLKHLLTADEKSQVEQYCTELKLRYNSSKNIPIFIDKESVQESLLFYPILSLVKSTLKSVTHDEDVKIYHLRHSFANYLYLVMNYRDDILYPEFILNEISSWCADGNIQEVSLLIRKELTLETHNFIKIMPAISQFMGHAHCETTIRHYIHIIHLHFFIFNENKMSHIIERRHLIAQTSIERSHGYKLIIRNGACFPAQSLVQYYLKKIFSLPKLPIKRLPKQTAEDFIVPIVEFKKHIVSVNDFYKIDAILKMVESNVLKETIQNRFQLTRNELDLIVLNCEKIKKLTGYRGYSVTTDVEGVYFSSKSFNSELIHKTLMEKIFYVISLLDLKKLKQISGVWRENYCALSGIVIDEVDYQKINKALLNHFFRFKLSTGKTAVHEKLGSRFGYQLLCYTQNSKTRSQDKNFSQAVFLLSLLLQLKEGYSHVT